MNLRQKTLLLTTLPLLSLLVILFGSFSIILQRSYSRLEQRDAERNLQRVDEVLAGDLAQLQSLTEDWAAWNDTYRFIQDQNPDFIESNLTKYAFESLQLNAVAFVGLAGDVVYGKGYDFEARDFLPLPSDLGQQLTPQSELMQFPHLAHHHQGIIQVNDRFMLVVIEPILRSDATGPASGRSPDGALPRSRLTTDAGGDCAQWHRWPYALAYANLRLQPLNETDLPQIAQALLTSGENAPR
jgi:sensor domain CHASE-containing protein